MAQGITFTSDAKVTIDLKKYGSKLMDFFRSEGVEEKAEKILYKPNRKTIGAIQEAKTGKTIKFDSLDSFMEWAHNV
jgi:hypothetical protein